MATMRNSQNFIGDIVWKNTGKQGVQDVSGNSGHRGASNTETAPKNIVITTSSLEKWWLTTFKGFTIVHTSLLPRQNTLGQIRYSKRWTLNNSED